MKIVLRASHTIVTDKIIIVNLHFVTTNVIAFTYHILSNAVWNFNLDTFTFPGLNSPATYNGFAGENSSGPTTEMKLISKLYCSRNRMKVYYMLRIQ